MINHSYEHRWVRTHNVLQRLRGLRKPRHLMSLILTRTPLASLLTMQIGDVRLGCFPSSISAGIWENPTAYSSDLDFLRRYLRPDDVFVDVGANIGYLSITAAKAVGPGGQVFSFEAHPRISAYLEKNVALNRLSNTVVRNLALGNTNGVVDLCECPGDDSQSWVAQGRGAFSVPMMCLDDALRDLRSAVALLKVDVEGYEKFVLEGAGRILSSVMCIYIECSAQNFSRYGYGPETLLAFLTKAGFTLYRREYEVCWPIITKYIPTSICENLIGVRCSSEFFNRTGYSLGS